MSDDPLDEALAAARTLEANGRASEAIVLLEAVDERSKARGLWCFARGALAFRAGDVDTAEACFARAVAIEPELAEYRANLGAVLLERAKWGDDAAVPKALATLEEALRWGPTQPEVWVTYAAALLAAKKPEHALKACDDALARAPGHLGASFNRAAALAALGREREALEALTALLAQAPTLEVARAAHARLSAKLERA